MLVYGSISPVSIEPRPAVEPVAAAPDTTTPTKAIPIDKPVGFDGASEPVVLAVEIEPYAVDGETPSHKLAKLHVVCVAVGFTLPADPAELLSGNHPSGTVDTSADLGGKTYEVAIPGTSAVVGATGGPAQLVVVKDLED